MKEELDLNARCLQGKIFEINDGEMSAPPVNFITEDYGISTNGLTDQLCLHTGCSENVVVSEEGNVQYAWYFLTNKGNEYAGVTIKRWWVYLNKWHFDTQRHRLYPGEHKEVFSFPRNQNPKCCIIACNIITCNIE